MTLNQIFDPVEDIKFYVSQQNQLKQILNVVFDDECQKLSFSYYFDASLPIFDINQLINQK